MEYANVTYTVIEETSGANLTNISRGIPYGDFINTWHKKTRVYCSAILAVFGCCFNLLAFLVFFKSKLRFSTTGAYLMTLAWVDSFVLILEVLAITNSMAISDTSCKITYYLRLTFKLLDAFIVVTLCIERTICFIFPLTSYKCSNKMTARLCIVAETLASCALCSHAILYFIKYGPRCYAHPDKTFHFIDFIISVFFGEVITSIIVSSLAVYIMRSLSKIKKKTESMRHLHKERKDKNLDKQISRMTAAVAVTFTCFRLPYSILYIVYWVQYYYFKFTYDGSLQAIDIASIFSMFNYCTNFIFYMIFWETFRIKCLSLLRCCKSGGTWKRNSTMKTSQRTIESTSFIE